MWRGELPRCSAHVVIDLVWRSGAGSCAATLKAFIVAPLDMSSPGIKSGAPSGSSHMVPWVHVSGCSNRNPVPPACGFSAAWAIRRIPHISFHTQHELSGGMRKQQFCPCSLYHHTIACRLAHDATRRPSRPHRRTSTASLM